MEAGTRQTPRETPDIRQIEAEAPEGKQAVEQVAAHGKQASDGAKSSALEWLLSDTEEDGDNTLTFELNVGGAKPGQEHMIRWTIQPVDGELIRRIRRNAVAGRQGRRNAQEGGDNEMVNRRLVVAGTVEPNISQAAQQLGIADPAMVVERRFRRKPGLIQQLAVEILSLSGYDDDDVREVEAAGN